MATIIYENFQAGRVRSVWLSVSQELAELCRKDFRDIGVDIRLYKVQDLGEELPADGVLFSTYASLNKKKHFDRIIQWCGDSFEGVVCILNHS